MAFTSDLVVRQVGDVDWEVVQPLRYEGNTDMFEVPKGSTTDFASVPFVFEWLLPRTGRYTKPAVLHDYLCRHGDEVGCPVQDADGIFRRAMAELDVPFLRRWVMWAAVRWRSLIGSHFRAGPGDLPQVLLTTLMPGLLVTAGGLVVLGLLLGWFLVESVVALLMLVLQWLVPPVRTRTKPVTRPQVRWAA